MLRSLLRCGVLSGGLAAGACNLGVQNPNRPENERLLANPVNFEALLGSTYLRWHSAVYAMASFRGMATVLSFESFSNLNNNGMNQVIGIPRSKLNNAVGNATSPDQRRLYYIGSEVARTASNLLAALDDPTFTLGTPARDARARAFAEFVRGLSLGYIALMYDSASIIHPALDPEDPGALVGYQEVMGAALDAFQKSIDAATTQASGADGFPLPAAWIPSPHNFTAAEFVRLVRSYRARLRANVARTPAERAAVDWDAVIADARNGITADHFNTTNTTTGPLNAWLRQWNLFGVWHQAPPFIIGMADVSGSYAAWIATPLDQRGTDGNTPLISTPDLRFPQGATRAAQQADLVLPCNPVPCKRYFRNRTGTDNLVGPSWGWSNYDHVRFNPWAVALGNGNTPFFTRAELDLLEAEGHIRHGDGAAAAALINRTRVPNGLPPLTNFALDAPVPGGADCVPKVPVAPGFTVIACGNLMEALKYEKRLETMFTHFAAWFLDMRGWGDLVEGTALHWAPPWEDLQARGYQTFQIYSTGGLGAGSTGSAAKGTYGW